MAWPKGKARKVKEILASAKTPKAEKVTRKNYGGNWDAEKSDDVLARVVGIPAYNWRDRSYDDLLSLPEEAKEFLAAYGLSAQWCTKSVFGQEQTKRFADFMANGWTPVEEGTIPGVTVVERNGTVLCVRPKHISDKAKAEALKQALAAWETPRSYLKEGAPLGSGAGRHQSAIDSNRFNRSYERIEVPADMGFRRD